MAPLPLPWLTLTRIGIGVSLAIIATAAMLYVVRQAPKRDYTQYYTPTYLPASQLPRG